MLYRFTVLTWVRNNNAVFSIRHQMEKKLSTLHMLDRYQNGRARTILRIEVDTVKHFVKHYAHENNKIITPQLDIR